MHVFVQGCDRAGMGLSLCHAGLCSGSIALGWFDQELSCIGHDMHHADHIMPVLVFVRVIWQLHGF